MDKFWNCLVEGTDGGYHYKHETLDQAIEEAKRLARQPYNKGKKVFVLEATGYCEVPETPVEYHNM